GLLLCQRCFHVIGIVRKIKWNPIRGYGIRLKVWLWSKRVAVEGQTRCNSAAFQIRLDKTQEYTRAVAVIPEPNDHAVSAQREEKSVHGRNVVTDNGLHSLERLETHRAHRRQWAPLYFRKGHNAVFEDDLVQIDFV